MSESDRLSLAELERYDPQPLARGDSRHYLCPFCHDERPGRRRDNAHRKLRVWPHGAWCCVRCERRGLLDEHKTKADEADPLRPGWHRGGAKTRARARFARPNLPPAPVEPTRAELDEDARKRARLRRLWADSMPLDAPLAVGARTYLAGRGIPPEVAGAARVRYSPSWGSANTYTAPAVLFPVQNSAAKLVAAEGRFMTPPADVAKTHSAGAKSQGVFAATPGALDADGETLCEGPITALAVAACGFPAVALCGHVVRPWLVRRLALRSVFVSLDWYEDKAEENAAEACRALAAVGATPYRLAPPDGAGDWADYLQAVGLERMRADLTAAICGALVPPSGLGK